MAEEKKKEERKLTDLQKAFLDHLFDEAEGDVRKAMDLAGYSKFTRLSEVLEPLAEEISDRALKAISANAGKAVFSLIQVLNTPHQNGAANKIKAAQAILERAGVQRKSEGVQINLPENGIVILPAKKASGESSED